MKESFYNYYIQQDNIFLLYNSLNNSYLVIKKEIFDNMLVDEKLSIEKILNEYPSFYQSFITHGFIIEADMDEICLYENMSLERKLSKTIYHLTINPTLDCNLKCWYCYESHIEKSSISNKTITDIINHLTYKCQYDPFKTLDLNFFGGEPLLKPHYINTILCEVKRLSKEFNFDIHIHFTTNGTVLSKSLIETLKDWSTSFQITFDGNKKTHDSVRMKKKSVFHKGSYDLIINNIKYLTNAIKDCKLNIRINFSENTFDQLDSLVDDLDFCDRKRIVFSLQKVWQVNSKSVNKAKLFEFINYAKSKNFIVNYMLLNNYNGSSCYADNLNQAVINYDGNVFKCTARDFKENNRVGILSKEGFICWDTKIIMDRMNIRISDKCKKCKLLPSCPGICSQNRIEAPDKRACILDTDFSIDEYIIHNFNNKMLEKRVQKS